MFLLLVRKELLEHLLGLRFGLSCILCLVISLSSTFVLTRDYREALADYQTNLVIHKDEAEKENDLVWGGIKVDKPLNPMQIFFRGVDRKLTATAKVGSLGEPQLEAGLETNPVALLFPSIGMLFFIGVVMSLLAIAFSYDTVAGEKELGTLKLLMSYSLPRDQVLLAKWVGGYAALVLPFLLSVVSGLVIVVLFPSVDLRADHYAALGGIAVLAMLYLGVMYSLGVFVSARTQLASTSITILLMVWVLMVLVVPNIAPYIAGQIRPLRSATSVDRQKYQLEVEDNAQLEELMKAWEEKHPKPEDDQDAQSKWWGQWWVYWDVEKRDRILRLVDMHKAIDDEYQNRMRGQIGLAEDLSRLSPLASFAYAATDLSGTGVDERNRFVEQLPEYRKQISVFALDKWVLYDGGEVEGRYTIEGHPVFTYEETRFRDRIGGILGDVLVLGLWTVLLFMGAYVSFLRYDVT